MGKNNRRTENYSNRNSEKEFNEMKKRIMSANAKVRSNNQRSNTNTNRPNTGRSSDKFTNNIPRTNGTLRYNKKPNNQYQSDNRRSNYRSNNQGTHDNVTKVINHTLPEPKMNQFLAMIDDIYTRMSEVAKNEHPHMIFEVIKHTEKMESGSAYVIFNIRPNMNQNDTRETSIVVYYTEDYSVNPKKIRYIKEYNSCLMVVNKLTSSILFNKFGSNAIERSVKYIESILNRTIGFFYVNDKKNESENTTMDSGIEEDAKYNKHDEDSENDTEVLENSCNE